MIKGDGRNVKSHFSATPATTLNREKFGVKSRFNSGDVQSDFIFDTINEIDVLF